MLKFDAWQLAVVGVVALAILGIMGAAVLRMFPATAGSRGTIRKSTPLESGLYVGRAEAGQQVFDGWSYRVQARYAGRARIVLDGSTVSVAGPRAPMGLYKLWMWLQAITFALVAPALVAAAVKLDWRWLLVSLGMLLLSTAFMAIGAGVWPGMGEVALVADGAFEATEFDASAVSDLGMGKWAADGMQVVLVHYKPMIDQIAAGRTVTFRAPDGYGHDVRYALQLYSDEDAQALLAALKQAGAK